MSTFTVEGKELVIKIVKPHGNGAIVYLSKAWIGERVGVIRDIKNGEI